MTITLQSTGFDLTAPLRQFATEKVEDACRAFGDMDREPVQIEIELARTTRHHRKGEDVYRAEANVRLPGRFLRAEASSDDLRKAIVEMKHKLTRVIRQWRERLVRERRSGARQAKRQGGNA